MIKVTFEFTNLQHLRDFLGATADSPNSVTQPQMYAPNPAFADLPIPPIQAETTKKPRKAKAKADPDQVPMDAPEEPRSEAETATGSLTVDDGRAAGKRLIDRLGGGKGSAKFMELIRAHGAVRISDLPLDKMAEFIKACDAVQTGD